MKEEDLKWFKSSRKPVFHQKRISHSGFTSMTNVNVVQQENYICSLYSRVDGRSENPGLGGK